MWEEHRAYLKVAKNYQFLAVDTESDGLNGRILGISIAFNNVAGMYYPIGHLYNDNCPPDILEELREFLERHTGLIFHNAKHDLEVLERSGFKLNNNYYCTMMMYHFVHENFPKDLTSVSKFYGGEPKERPKAMSAAIAAHGWGKLPHFLTKDYAAHDAKITSGIFDKLKPEFDAEFKPDLWEYEKDFIDVMRNIERAGIKIDRDLCRIQAITGQEVMEEIVDEIGWIPSSSLDLNKFLIEDMDFPIVKLTPKGKPSFDKTAMEEYDILLENAKSPVAKQVLRYRGWLKTVSSNYNPYLLLADANDILHPNFKLHGTKT
ncbi:MAG: hypothetical protein ACREOB_00060, partial [Thermodesulfobacteriota bacterium]